MLIYSQIKIIRKEIKTMPIMDIRTLRLPKDKKDALAKGISEAVLPFIAPHFQIYFNEYEEIYLNGEQVAEPDSLAKAVNDAVMKVLNTGTTFVYHPNESKHVLLNGKSLASMMEE